MLGWFHEIGHKSELLAVSSNKQQITKTKELFPNSPIVRITKKILLTAIAGVFFCLYHELGTEQTFCSPLTQ
jgi:hypothetical protein